MLSTEVIADLDCLVLVGSLQRIEREDATGGRRARNRALYQHLDLCPSSDTWPLRGCTCPQALQFYDWVLLQPSCCRDRELVRQDVVALSFTRNLSEMSLEIKLWPGGCLCTYAATLAGERHSLTPAPESEEHAASEGLLRLRPRLGSVYRRETARSPVKATCSFGSELQVVIGFPTHQCDVHSVLTGVHTRQRAQGDGLIAKLKHIRAFHERTGAGAVRGDVDGEQEAGLVDVGHCIVGGLEPVNAAALVPWTTCANGKVQP